MMFKLNFIQQEETKLTFENAKEILDAIARDINNLNNMQINDAIKEMALEELLIRKNNIKTQMHQYIEAL